jgi:hypothetical protein
MRVFVLLFNARTNNEGIHTLQTGERHKILMFQDEDDATRFALLLEAQDFPPATVEAMDSQDVEEFCRQANYEWELVEEGRLEIPPAENVPDTDWELGHQPAVKEAETELPSDELDRIRRQLEGLL